MAELVESLTETMAKKQAAKYDPALEADARSFLVGLFGGEAAFGDLVAKLSAGEKMQPLLKDGVLLCHAANKVCPGLVPRVNSSSLPFKQRENISGYLTGCEKLGFNSAELFETVDLFDDKDMMRVFNSLRVLKTYKEKYDPETLKERLSKATEKKAPVTAKPTVAVGSPAPRRVVTTRSSSSLASSSSPVASPTIQRRNPEAPPSVSSLENDIAVANEFKYSVELERIACDWMGKVLDKDLATPSFIECIKSGVVLCELLNKIKPGTVTAKIHDSRIAYRQMENIGNYLKGCEALGMRQTDLFNTVDLFEEKNLHLVIKNIVVLGNTVQGKDYYSGPKIEDASKTKNLWSESLAMTDLSKEVDEDDLKETPPEHQEWVDWINSQLIRLEPGSAVPPVRNLTSNLRSGVVLMRLVEVLTGQCIHAWEKEPQYLWQYMNNASAVLRFITSITFEVVTVCKARDIVSKNTTAIIALLQILRDKFDLDFLFQKILSEELDDSEREIHRHLFISVPPSDTPSPMPRSPRGEDEGEEERVVVEEADKQPSQSGHQAAHQEQKGKEKDEDEGANSTKAPTPCKFDEEQQQTGTMVSPGIQTQQQQQQQQEGQQQPQEKIASPREIVKPQSPKKVTEEKDVQPTTPKSEAKQEEDEEDEEGQEEEEQDEEEEENEDEGGEKDKQDDTQTTEKTESKDIDVNQDLEKKEQKKVTEEEAAQKPKTKKKKKQKTESTTEDKKKKTKKTKKIKKKGSSEVRSRSKIRPSESASSPTTQSEIVVTLPSSMSSTDVQTKKTKKKTGSGSKAKARPKSLGEDQSKIIGQLLTTSEDKQALTGKKKKSKAGSGFVSGSSSALAVKKEKKRRKSFGPTTGKSIVVEEDPTAAAATTAEKESSSKKGSAVKERKSRSKRGKPSSQKKAIVKKQQEEPPKVEDTTTANNENEEETKLPETKEEESKEKVAEESKATPSSPQSPLKQEEEEAKEKEQPPSLEEQKAPSHPQPQKSTESTVTAAASADSSNEGTPREDSPWVAAKPPVRVAKVLPTRATSLSDINAIKMERARNVVRKRVATEILTTEMSYVDSLQTLVNQVVVPLQKSAMRVLTETEHKNLFWNLDRILNVHEEFLVVLQQKLKGWSTETTIGDVFLYQTAFLEEYKEYMQGYNASLVLLRHLDKRKPAFKQVREAFELKQKTKTCLPLDAFMIMPIQRVPRYALLLRELHKYTNPLHPDYNLLDQAATHINRKLEVLNKGVDMEVASRAQKINSIEDSIEGEIIPGESLFHPDRKVLKEGPLKWQASGETSKKQVYLFLFNDLLLCCLNKKKKDKDGTSFTILFTQRMKDIARINDDKVDSGSFVLEVNTGDKHLVQAKNKTEALLWISVLNMR
ncbi:Transgelin-3 [Balamuthia mandrillaris]